jgi:hypothetical protein
VPPVADHVTDEPAPPSTAAVHWDVAFGAIVAGLQLTATLAAVVLTEDLLLPPQAVNREAVKQASAPQRRKRL